MQKLINIEEATQISKEPLEAFGVTLNTNVVARRPSK
jgi:hypothetical protein